VSEGGDSLYMVDDGKPCGPQGLEALRVPAEGAKKSGGAVAMTPAVVEFRFADEEPIRSFIEAVASALGLFGGVDFEELPDSARLGVMELRAACEAVGASVPSRMGADSAYRGVIDPLLEGEPVQDGDSFRSGVFPFAVSEMRVRER
jgi:hypothetical protein